MKKTDQMTKFVSNHPTLAIELLKKERQIKFLIKGLRKNRRLKAQFNAENQSLRQELKRLRHQNSGLKAGMNALKTLAKSRRDALETIAYLHEESNGKVSVDLTRAEAIALRALNWNKHQ